MIGDSDAVNNCSHGIDRALRGFCANTPSTHTSTIADAFLPRFVGFITTQENNFWKVMSSCGNPAAEQDALMESESITKKPLSKPKINLQEGQSLTRLSTALNARQREGT